MLETVLFVVGFFILIKGADLLVAGASSIARRLNIPDLIIGMTIVSLGTSFPELFVNVISSFEGSAEIGIGNVLGSNIANILLVLGISALILPLPITRNTVYIEIPFSLCATALVGFLANATIINHTDLHDSISRLDGFILLFFFLLFIGYIYNIVKENNVFKEEIKTMSTGRAVIYLILGMIGLFLGGEWVVNGAIYFAGIFGLSESFVGLTIVALGTSLPELVTSIIAVMKKNTEIAVGNVIGSNIFNLLWILGVSALIKPLPYDTMRNDDIFMVMIASALLILSVTVGNRATINRWKGGVFVFVYLSYIVFLIWRE